MPRGSTPQWARSCGQGRQGCGQREADGARGRRCQPPSFSQGLPIDTVGPEQDSASHGAEDEDPEEENEGTQDTVAGRQQPWGWGRPSVPPCHWLTAALCLFPAVAANSTAAFPGRAQRPEGGRLGVSLGAGGLGSCSPRGDA